MVIGKFIKKTINILGTITKVSLELGTEAIGSIAEKIDDNPESRNKIVDYGKRLGQTIRKNTNEFAESSANVVDNAVDTSIRTYTNISNELGAKFNEVSKKYQEKNNKYYDQVLNNTSNPNRQTEFKNTTKDYTAYVPEATFEVKQQSLHELCLEEIANDSIAILDEDSGVLGSISKGNDDTLDKAKDYGIKYQASATIENDEYGLYAETNITNESPMILKPLDHSENICKIKINSPNPNPVGVLPYIFEEDELIL